MPCKLHLPGLCLLALAGCTAPPPATPANVIAQNDFEGLAGWVAVPPSLTNERARSGHYCVKVDKDNEYSLGYSGALAAAGLPAGGRLRVQGWGLRTGSQAGAAVVVQVVDPARADQSVFWQKIPISKQVITYNRWVPVQETFTLPATLPPGCLLKVYLWRDQDTQPTYLDDLQLLRD